MIDLRKYRALLIANSMSRADPASFPELKGPKYDPVLLHGALVDPHVGLFRQDRVFILLERDHSQVTTEMERFFRSAQPREQLLLYFSGHGDKDLSNRFYLCCSDTKRDALMATGISDALIDGLMEQSSAQSLVVILDCCYSGAAFKGGAALPALQSSGTFVLQSSGAEQTSRDAEHDTEASAFTRHLIDALLAGRLDGNQDGLVGFDDVFAYVSSQLAATGQIAHRKVKGSGDVPLARALPMTVPLPKRVHGERPIIRLSRTAIEIRDVAAGATIPTEIVTVTNAGGGTLNWTVRSQTEWIAVERHGDEFRLHLTPPPGLNRGTVRVADATSGSTALVDVTVTVLPPPEDLPLAVSQSTIDFGVLSHGAASPRHAVHLRTPGAGRPQARLSVDQDWVDARLFGEIVVVAVKTDTTGDLCGEITVETDNAVARIAVHAVVEPGPLLAVEPAHVDFGTVADTTTAVQYVRVHNQGSGELRWDFGATGEFFTVKREGDGLRVGLLPQPGRHMGSIWVTSNGGVANVDVRAETLRTAPPPPPPPPVAHGTRPPLKAAQVRLHWGRSERVFSPGPVVTIGRSTRCHVRTENPCVSAVHARLAWESNHWVLVDAGSAEGIFHAGTRVPRVDIRDVTMISLGPPGRGQPLVVVPGSRRRAFLPPNVGPPGPGQLRIRVRDQTVDFRGPGPVTVGRDPGSHLVLDNPFVSERHAVFRIEAGRWVVEDTGSRRGTFREEQRVGRVEVERPTVVTFGPPDSGEHVVVVPGPVPSVSPPPPLRPSPPPPPPPPPRAPAPAPARGSHRRRTVVIWAIVILTVLIFLALLV